MIEREMKQKLLQLASQFPVIGLLGPRQSGKTTLSQTVFPEHQYLSLEDLDKREFAKTDPRGFLLTYENKQGLILDEIQHVSELLSYIQTDVDRRKKPGYYILPGSQNITISEHISQTLAGRISILTLLPLTITELKASQLLPHNLEQLLFQGSYPSIYSASISPTDWYPNYIRTYIERDVRQIKNVSDLNAFQRFMKLCAGRIGQLLNLSSLSNDCGVSVSTIKAWISILEASYVVFLLSPHHVNFSKRLVKSPKLYFHDTGLACSLLGIESSEELVTHYLRGGIFESFVISELRKKRLNQGQMPNLYFWRDKTGHEIDCLAEKGKTLIPIEIKSGQTISSDYFQGLIQWSELAGQDPSKGYIIYGGMENQVRQQGHILSWRSLDTIL